MTRTRIIAVLGGFLLAGCLASCPTPPGPGPTPGPTGGIAGQAPVPTGGSAGSAGEAQGGSGGVAPATPCDLDGAQLVRLKCIYLTELQSWVAQCQKAATVPGASLDHACLQKAATKAAVRACQSVPCAEVRP